LRAPAPPGDCGGAEARRAAPAVLRARLGRDCRTSSQRVGRSAAESGRVSEPGSVTMYVCALRPRGEPLSRADVFGYITRMKRDGASMHSIVEGPFAAVALERPGQHRSLLARHGCLIGAGDVRLDNREEIAKLAELD